MIGRAIVLLRHGLSIAEVEAVLGVGWRQIKQAANPAAEPAAAPPPLAPDRQRRLARIWFARAIPARYPSPLTTSPAAPPPDRAAGPHRPRPRR